MINEIIRRLNELVIPVKEGSTGYSVLASSETVTAYKIQMIARDLEKQQEGKQ